MRPPRATSGSSSAAAAAAVAMAMAAAAAASAPVPAPAFGLGIESKQESVPSTPWPTNSDESDTSNTQERSTKPPGLTRRASASGKMMRASEDYFTQDHAAPRKTLLSSSSSPTSLRALFDAGANTVRTPASVSSQGPVEGTFPLSLDDLLSPQCYHGQDTEMDLGKNSKHDDLDHSVPYSSSASSVSSTPNCAHPGTSFGFHDPMSTSSHPMTPMCSPPSQPQSSSLPPTPKQYLQDRSPDVGPSNGTGRFVFPPGHQFQAPTASSNRHSVPRRASSSSFISSQRDHHTKGYPGSDDPNHQSHSILMRSNSTPAALRSPFKTAIRSRHLNAAASRRQARYSMNLYASTDKVIQDLSLPQQLYRNPILPQRHTHSGSLSQLQFQLKLQQAQTSTSQSQPSQTSQASQQSSQPSLQNPHQYGHSMPSQSQLHLLQGLHQYGQTSGRFNPQYFESAHVMQSTSYSSAMDLHGVQPLSSLQHNELNILTDPNITQYMSNPSTAFHSPVEIQPLPVDALSLMPYSGHMNTVDDPNLVALGSGIEAMLSNESNYLGQHRHEHQQQQQHQQQQPRHHHQQHQQHQHPQQSQGYESTPITTSDLKTMSNQWKSEGYSGNLDSTQTPLPITQMTTGFQSLLTQQLNSCGEQHHFHQMQPQTQVHSIHHAHTVQEHLPVISQSYPPQQQQQQLNHIHPGLVQQHSQPTQTHSHFQHLQQTLTTASSQVPSHAIFQPDGTTFDDGISSCNDAYGTTALSSLALVLDGHLKLLDDDDMDMMHNMGEYEDLLSYISSPANPQ